MTPVFLALALLVLGAGALRVLRLRTTPGKPSLAIVASPVTVLNVRLSPGVSKGIEKRMTEIEAPPPGSKVLFTLELPGKEAPADCSVVLLRLDSEGRSATVWSGSAVESHTTAATEVTVHPDPSVLTPADYLMRLEAPDGRVLEVFLFGVRSR